MSVRLIETFDAETLAAIAAGFVNGTGATWVVSTVNPISGAHSLTSSSKGSLDLVILSDTGSGAPAAAADMGVQFDQKILSPLTVHHPSIGWVVRSNAAGTQFYLALLDSFTGTTVDITIFKFIGGSYIPVTPTPITISLAIAAGDIVHGRLSLIGATFNFYLSTNDTALPTTPSAAYADTTGSGGAAAITAAGYAGLIYSVNTATAPVMGADNLQVDDGLFNPGFVYSTGVTDTTAALVATPAGGGSTLTSTVPGQWHRSTTSGFTPGSGNALSGATGTRLNDTGLTGSTTYYYRKVWTDGAGTVVMSPEFSITTSGGASAVTVSPTTASGAVGSSVNFTVTHNGSSASDTITPNDGGDGGSFSPPSASVSGFGTATFAYTSVSAGTKSLTFVSSLGFTSGTATLTAVPGLEYTRVDATDYRTGQNIMVLVPNVNSAHPYSSGTPTGVILYAHGAGEDQTALLTDSLKVNIVNALLDAGYILAGTNAHGENWGCQAAVDDYAALDEYLRANYNVSNVVIWVQSMGGLAGALALAQNKVKGVVGLVGIYPVFSLSDLYGIGTFTAEINTAYGITGSGIHTYAHQTYGHDPVLLPALASRNVPTFLTSSSGDTVVPKAQNADVYHALIAGSCRENILVATSGDHGDLSNFTTTIATQITAFVGRCLARPVNTRGMAVTGGMALVSGGVVVLDSGLTIPVV